MPSLVELVQRGAKTESKTETGRPHGMPTFAQIAAIQTLGDIGPAAKAAVPVLETFGQQHPFDQWTRPAIEKIQGTYRGSEVQLRSKQPGARASEKQ